MIKITAVLAFATLGLAACGGSSYSSSSTTKTTKPASSSSGGGYGAPASKTTAASSTSSKAATNEIDMNDNFFSPKAITGKPGQTVTITLKNKGSNQHNFKIDSQLKQADADVKPGTNATVKVTIPKSGTLQFYCEYHKGLGMVGTVKAA